MNADMILQSLSKMRADTLSELIEVDLLGADDETLDAIEASGGKIGERHWEVWCDSAGRTCACNSHDPGQEHQTVHVPESWMIKESYNFVGLFEGIESNDHLTGLMIIPSDQAQLVYEIQKDHWAAHTHIAPRSSISMKGATAYQVLDGRFE